MSSSQNNVDIDALLDLSEFDGNNSPSPSPNMSSKPAFAGPSSGALTTPTLNTSFGTTQALSRPSHNYELYRQQTGFVPGAIANTMAVNESSNTGYQQEFDRLDRFDYLDRFAPENDLFDFNTSPSQDTVASEMMDFDSPQNSQLFTVNPSSIEQEPPNASPISSSTHTSNVGRLWPGAHSQAALAKAQAQQRQQQQQSQQQQQQAPRQAIQQQAKPRAKAPQPSDPFVEQKITQLLNSMRANPSRPDSGSPSPMSNLPRLKKEEEDMDADERLLASEEGKKLSSKERRQLRNKVSARAFRSRRKEYISQLEAEVAGKVTENNDLRAQNRALLDENKRLSDLTRMLLSSPSFSNFLDHLSVNPMPAAQPAPIKTEPQPQSQPQPERRNVPKDIGSYGYQHQPSQQQIGMAMIPEQNVDFAMLALSNGMNYQPQVFMTDIPALPAPLDLDALSGKSSNFIEETLALNDEKIEAPVIERFVEPTPAAAKAPSNVPLDEEFESDPEFALFHAEPESDERERGRSLHGDHQGSHVDDLFGGIETEKLLSRIELVDVAGDEAHTTSAMAMARVQAISARIAPLVSRLELLTAGW